MTNNPAPVLSVDWHSQGAVAFFGGCDKAARRWDLASNQVQQVAGHDAPVSCVKWMEGGNLLATGSWDATLRFWDLRQARPTSVVKLPERLYCMDITSYVISCGCANRQVAVYDARRPSQPRLRKESPLKMQTRCIANLLDLSGFALASIEGRCAIEYFEPNHANSFAFKCHRRNEKEIFAVNAIAMHPNVKCFATCGSDGEYTFWDRSAKQRTKATQPHPLPVTTGAFNRNGRFFAYSVCYDWSRGVEAFNPRMPTLLMTHMVTQQDLTPPRN